MNLGPVPRVTVAAVVDPVAVDDRAVTHVRPDPRRDAVIVVVRGVVPRQRPVLVLDLDPAVLLLLARLEVPFAEQVPVVGIWVAGQRIVVVRHDEEVEVLRVMVDGEIAVRRVTDHDLALEPPRVVLPVVGINPLPARDLDEARFLEAGPVRLHHRRVIRRHRTVVEGVRQRRLRLVGKGLHRPRPERHAHDHDHDNDKQPDAPTTQPAPEPRVTRTGPPAHDLSPRSANAPCRSLVVCGPNTFPCERKPTRCVESSATCRPEPCTRARRRRQREVGSGAFGSVGSAEVPSGVGEVARPRFAVVEQRTRKRVDPSQCVGLVTKLFTSSKARLAPADFQDEEIGAPGLSSGRP